MYEEALNLMVWRFFCVCSWGFDWFTTFVCEYAVDRSGRKERLPSIQ